MGETAGRTAWEMTEDELVERAARARDRVLALAPGSVGFALQKAAFDAAMDELAIRASLTGVFGKDMRRQAVAIVSRRGGRVPGGSR